MITHLHIITIRSSCAVRDVDGDSSMILGRATMRYCFVATAMLPTFCLEDDSYTSDSYVL